MLDESELTALQEKVRVCLQEKCSKNINVVDCVKTCVKDSLNNKTGPNKLDTNYSHNIDFKSLMNEDTMRFIREVAKIIKDTMTTSTDDPASNPANSTAPGPAHAGPTDPATDPDPATGPDPATDPANGPDTPSLTTAPNTPSLTTAPDTPSLTTALTTAPDTPSLTTAPNTPSLTTAPDTPALTTALTTAPDTPSLTTALTTATSPSVEAEEIKSGIELTIAEQKKKKKIYY